MPLRSLSLIVFAALACAIWPAAAQPPVRLYTLDCGQITVSDANMFSDTQGYDGQTLLVSLEKAGKVILSGDLYHFQENRIHR